MPDLDQTPSAFWQTIKATHKAQKRTPAIQPAPRKGAIPLTFGQERLWWIDHLHAGTTAHNLRAVVHLRGRLNLPALHESLQTIVQRHEILRTRFAPVEGQPVQVIEPAMTLELPTVDLTHLPHPEQEAEVQRIAAAEARHPFDLARVPLLRLTLLRLAEDEAVLVRTIHHIIHDRWSDSVFISELAALYTAFAQGEPAPLPALPIQYADVALFQRQWLQGAVLAEHLDYWRQHLGEGGTVAPVVLPGNATFTAETGYHGDTQYLTIPSETTSKLKLLAQQEGVSLFVVLLAAFKTLLYQYSGQDAITLCAPVAGRHRVETRKLIGYLSNLVLFRTPMHDNPGFRALIGRVGAATVGALEHQDVPLQTLADALHIPASVLTRAMFALQNVPVQPRAMGDVTITPRDMPEGISNFDLSLSMKMRNGHLLGVLRYKTGLFQPTTITHLREQFQHLLTTLSANPDTHLSDLPRFTEHCPTHTGRQGDAEAPYVAPESQLEHTIAAIWQEVLRLERVSVEANFFALGGRSLDLVQLGSRLQSVLQQEIPLRELFTHPTIRLLAQYVRQQGETNQTFARRTQHRTHQQREALKRQQQMQRRRNRDDG